MTLQTVSNQIPKNGNILAILGSLSIAITPAVQKMALDQHQKFIDSNAAMQAMAREIYLFRAGIAPYDNMDTSLEDFVHNGRQIFTDLKDDMYWNVKHDGTNPPPNLDRESYTNLRVNPMKEKYTNEQRRYLKLSNFFSVVRDGCLGTSSLIGFVCSRPGISTMTKSFAVWSSVMATLGSAFANHLESHKFGDLSQECSKAAQELEDLLMLPYYAKDYESYVQTCEDVIASTTKSLGKIRRSGMKKVSDGKKPKKEKKAPKWNPDVICGDDTSGFYPASARVDWLIENRGMAKEEAKVKVMKEYPSMFLYEME